MTRADVPPVTVSRRIGVPAADVFRVLTEPRRHLDLDGSGMLRRVASGAQVSAVGDVFVMRMYADHLGDYEMNNHVVAYEPNSRLGWEPRPGRGHPDETQSRSWGHTWEFVLVPDGPEATLVTEIYDCSRVPDHERARMDDGRLWIESMTKTLELLESLCTEGRRAG
jgi:uncharacterized protein YndB with AHSA1/START domain